MKWVPGIRNAIMVCRTDQSSHLRQNNQVITNFLVESQGWKVESLSEPYHPLIRWWWSTILSHRKSCMQVNYLVIWSGFRGLRTDWWSAHHRLIIGWSSYHPSLIFPQWSDGIAIKLVFPSQIWAALPDMKMVLNGQRKSNAGDLGADPALKVGGAQTTATHPLSPIWVQLPLSPLVLSTHQNITDHQTAYFAEVVNVWWNY